MRESKLLPQHEAMLTASAVSADVAAERGYRSITTKAELKRLGYSDQQQGVPTLLVPIHGVSGGIVLHHHRPDQPRVDKRGKIVKYEFPAGSRMAVDVHPRLLGRIRESRVPLFITEGVKKADAAVGLGLCCIALIGTWNWRGTNERGGKTALPDWEGVALKSAHDEPRQVYICYDSDVMVKPQVHQALSRLSGFLKSRGASVAYIYLPHGEDGSKVGLDDYLAAGHTKDELMALATPTLREMPSESIVGGAVSGSDEIDDEGATVSQKLLALASGVQFFHSERMEAYARVRVKDHWQTHPVRSSTFKHWLCREYYVAYGKAAASQAVEEARTIFEAKARFDGAERTMNLRTARDPMDGSIYIDLGDRNWRAAHVKADGWNVVAEPPPLFRRHATQAALATPDISARPADIERLREFVNVKTEAAWRQLIVWLVAAWVPEMAHPVLIINGEQGTAKSTLMLMLSSLIDASQTPLRSEPKDEAQWMQTADHTWLVTIDNVSTLPGWLSDAFCRAVTGAGTVKRQLFTDAEDIVMAFRRVLAITCIEVVARRSDLLDRSILLGLEPIQADTRRSEQAVLADFEDKRGLITGALMSILSGVLRELPDVIAETAESVNLPRMADFANVGIAVERVLAWPEGSFMAAYVSSIGEQNQEALASAVIYEPLLKLIGDDPEFAWDGTPQQLLDELTKSVDEKMARMPEWPKNARALSNQLKRIAPNLRSIGVEVSVCKANRQRIIRIERSARATEQKSNRDARDAKSADLSYESFDEDIALAAIRG